MAFHLGRLLGVAAAYPGLELVEPPPFPLVQRISRGGRLRLPAMMPRSDEVSKTG